MKFQDSSFKGKKVTVGTKSVTHPRTHPLTDASKAICPINFFKVGGIIIAYLGCPPWTNTFLWSIKTSSFDLSHQNNWSLLMSSISVPKDLKSFKMT